MRLLGAEFEFQSPSLSSLLSSFWKKKQQKSEEKTDSLRNEYCA